MFSMQVQLIFITVNEYFKIQRLQNIEHSLCYTQLYFCVINNPKPITYKPTLIRALSLTDGVKLYWDSIPWGSLSSCHETSRRFLRYGNFFPSTFPEVLLAHASQMTGQLSQSMQIRRARDSINAMLATIISESFTSPWTRDGFSV